LNAFCGKFVGKLVDTLSPVVAMRRLSVEVWQHPTHRLKSIDFSQANIELGLLQSKVGGNGTIHTLFQCKCLGAPYQRETHKEEIETKDFHGL
jgi:hypothetical protein